MALIARTVITNAFTMFIHTILNVWFHNHNTFFFFTFHDSLHDRFVFIITITCHWRIYCSIDIASSKISQTYEWSYNAVRQIVGLSLSWKLLIPLPMWIVLLQVQIWEFTVPTFWNDIRPYCNESLYRCYTYLCRCIKRLKKSHS